MGWRNESQGMEGWSLVPGDPTACLDCILSGQTQPLTSQGFGGKLGDLIRPGKGPWLFQFE